MLLLLMEEVSVPILRRFFRPPFTQIKGHLIVLNRSATVHAAAFNFNTQMEPIYSKRDNCIRPTRYRWS